MHRWKRLGKCLLTYLKGVLFLMFCFTSSFPVGLFRCSHFWCGSSPLLSAALWEHCFLLFVFPLSLEDSFPKIMNIWLGHQRMWISLWDDWQKNNKVPHPFPRCCRAALCSFSLLSWFHSWVSLCEGLFVVNAKTLIYSHRSLILIGGSHRLRSYHVPGPALVISNPQNNPTR